MALADKPLFFVPDIEKRIEARASEVRAAGRKVNAFTAVWHLFLAPILLFGAHMLRRGLLSAGYAGFRESVHEAAFLFAVNARVYELTHADPSGLNAIKKEFE